jgi:predicted DNA-binding transcriptional regulator AlpA
MNTDWLAPYPDPMQIAHLAQALGLSTRTLERRIRAGRSMPKETRRIGHRRRWLKADVAAWVTGEDAPAVTTTKRRAHFQSRLRRAG